MIKATSNTPGRARDNQTSEAVSERIAHVQQVYSASSCNTSRPNLHLDIEPATHPVAKSVDASTSTVTSIYFTPLQEVPTHDGEHGYNSQQSVILNKFRQKFERRGSRSNSDDGKSEDRKSSGTSFSKDTWKEVVVIDVDENREFWYKFPAANTNPILSFRPLVQTKTGESAIKDITSTPEPILFAEATGSPTLLSSLDLSHRAFSLKSSRRRRVRHKSLGDRPASSDAIPGVGMFETSSSRLKFVKFSNGKEDQEKPFVKKHRRIFSGSSVTSSSDKLLQSLGIKHKKIDLKPMGIRDVITTYSVDIHHFSYFAPPSSIFFRYCPESLQAAFVAQRSYISRAIVGSNSLTTNVSFFSKILQQSPPRNTFQYMEEPPTRGASDTCILNDITFRARSRELSIVLGGSGSGKTTLLDAIANRLDGGKTTGKILINGLHCSTSTAKRAVAYVIQHDRLLPNLTVQETLSFVTRLTYPDYPYRALREKVNEVLHELGLTHVMRSSVGDGLTRGISGGERRRLSIACQLIKFTHILLLDEPTTGLDSFNTYNLIKTLARLSRKNIAVIATIHQPRSELFPLFDMITLMSQGHIVYHGRRKELIPYFTERGIPCPEYRNPLDHYIDTVSVDRFTPSKKSKSEEKLFSLIQEYKRSKLYKNLLSELSINEQKEHINWMDHFDELRPHNAYKLALLVHRMNINVVRSIRAFGMRLTIGLMFAVMLFAFVLRLGDDQAGMHNRVGLMFQIINGPTFFGILNCVDLFPTLRGLIYRESQDGLYHPGRGILAYFVHVFPFTVGTSILFGLVTYWGIGFYPDEVRSLYFMLVFFVLMMQGETVAVMVLGVINNPVVANGMISLVMSLSITVGSGFVRNFQSLHPVFEWLSFGSMHRYASLCLSDNEFTGLNFTCGKDEYCTYQNGSAYLDEAFPEAAGNKTLNLAILVGYGTILLVACHILYCFLKIPRLR